ncbi:SNF2-related protein [Chryseobacterium sp. Y16C]|uniref:Eco57I restriction-modification methylase domain-containing protein n=1 Tax=Chryseobacterium sp. Y16C TaxID=2920939 RepID=UPI001F0A3FE7|nr:SNF2-related protein [Chryseobacterium sp. Y16C]UMQ41559.1 SNF2-related protein [Chryseobacterium sp. Y16C]
MSLDSSNFTDDISIVNGSKNELIVFSKEADKLSFLELLKLNNQNNNRTLITLNSATNTNKFLNRYKDFDGKIFLCLEADRIGDAATLKILLEFKEKNVKDIRSMYEISQAGNKDLSTYLENKLNLQNKNINLVEPKNEENADVSIRSNRISDTQHLGSKFSERNSGESLQRSQSEQNGDHSGGQTLGSNNAGNGLEKPERSDSGNGGSEPIYRAKPGNVKENEGRKDSLGGILPGRVVSDRIERRVDDSKNIEELNSLVSKYRGRKLTNEQVAEVVSAACFVSEDKKVALHQNVEITDDIKNICNQYKSGGTAKEGRGILDEYYTDSKIVETIRNLIKDQFKNQKEISVLEPSVGTGNFLYAIKDLSLKINITAFEINDTTAKIAKIFHPEADINLRSFETEFINEKGYKTDRNQYADKYDLVIGNPPYGEHRGLYKGLGEEPKISKFEDYFVKRSLDSLKSNGLMAMVLPSGWLNRQKKLENAEIMKAYRLPSGAFAGTQIGTDIIILKKSSQKITQDVSDYFIKNPENILGEIREKSNRFGRMEQYVHGNLDNALAILEQLQFKKGTERIGNLFEDLFFEKSESKLGNSIANIKETNSEFEIGLNEVQAKIEEVLSTFQKIKFKSPIVIKEIEKYTKLQRQIEKDVHSFSFKELKDVFDKSEKIIQTYNRKDSEYRTQTKPEIKKGVLKYLFSKSDEVVNTSLQNSSSISKEQIEAFRDTNYDGTLNNYGKHYQFANFIDGKWVHDFYYAEGNIYAKLEQLEKDFVDKYAVGGTEDQYDKQMNLLLSVVPIPKSLDDIFISPNHEFVHKFALGQVEKERYNSNTRLVETVIVDYNLAEKFKDFVGDLSSDAFAGSSAWEVKSFVDNETVTGSDKERNALVRERRKVAANDLFQKFIREELSDELRERFIKDFNRNFNSIYVPDYSKFPLFSKIFQNFKGKELRLTEVQKAGIGRLTTKGVGLLAHEVGFGKTLSGILSMHEAMERGNAKRPLIVVPNDSILKQWVETVFETIPNAKVNVLGNLGKDYDLSKFDNRDGEITIVTYEGFNNIGFSENITQDLASKYSYISESELRSVNSISERDFQIELEKEKELEGKMKRGKIYDWEDFGFDHMTFDEVHNANHIVGKVRIEDRRFASDFRSQNQQTSKLGMNTWMASQYIQNKYDGRNVTLLSATPFTNKPLEYYSILSLIANKRLEESGYFNVNTFFETFMEADTDMEIDARGDVKFKANVRRFKNNSLFQQLLSEFIDIKGEEDNPELIRPNKINKEYKIEQNDLTQEQYDLLKENFEETQKGAILTHILNARLIAISPYLSPYYDGELPSVKEFIENSPKLIDTMNLIRQNKNDIPDSGQIIYSELAVSEFQKMKDYLVTEVGYKPEEVGVITGATTKPNRLKIQDDFNSGKIKIIIGSEAIQEGMNLQENTTDLYMLSLPYNFTTLRQVEGRAWRQGNKHENVRVNFMLTNDSIDVFMLQKLQSKQARYLEAMKKGANVLDVSDISTQELKTSIITDPETRANIEIELLKKRIEIEKNKHLADIAFVLRKHNDFLKVKEMVTKAEESYSRIVGYSKNVDGNTDYWKNQLPSYQKTIDLAKSEVQKTIEVLAEKGVNVEEIEVQTKSTEDKISELDKKIEELPNIQVELIVQYKKEKEEKLRQNQSVDNAKERSEENLRLFALSDKKLNIPEFKNSKQISNEENMKILSNAKIKR